MKRFRAIAKIHQSPYNIATVEEALSSQALVDFVAKIRFAILFYNICLFNRVETIVKKYVALFCISSSRFYFRYPSHEASYKN